MTDPKIIDKIKKCFALDGSPEPEEAAASLAHARRLMEKYGIRQKDIDMSRVQERSKDTERKRPVLYQNMLIQVIAGSFGCKVIYDDQWSITKANYVTVIKFIGLEPNAEIAQYAYDILYRNLKRARSTYLSQLKRYSKHRKLRASHAFCCGWAAGVFDKIQKLIPEQEVPAIVEDYFNEKYPATVDVSKPPKEKPALKNFINGIVASSDADLNKGMNGSSKLYIP